MTKEEFLTNVTDWENHRPLLWLALEKTTKGDVIEYGSGGGSTLFLRKYCKDAKRGFISMDDSRDWALKYESIFIDNWDMVNLENPSVILIDHSPGTRRVVDIIKHKNINGIIVVHDTQPPPTGGDYKFNEAWKHFKYRVHLTSPINTESTPSDNRNWATAVSNTYDVTKWRGQTFNNGEYILI